MTGKVTGIRQHSPFQFTKELDSSSPYLFKAAATGQTLKSAEFRFYHINHAGQEVEYYRITLENVKVISVSPVMQDTRGCPGTGHMAHGTWHMAHGRSCPELRENHSPV